MVTCATCGVEAVLVEQRGTIVLSVEGGVAFTGAEVPIFVCPKCKTSMVPMRIILEGNELKIGIYDEA